MAYGHAVLVYGQNSQTLEFYSPVAEVIAEGAPTSATFDVYRGTESNDNTAQFSGTATLDATSTTVAAATGYSQTARNKAFLTALTNIVGGRRYLLTNELAVAQREVVVPISGTDTTTDFVTLEDDLVFNYSTTSSTFKGLRFSAAVDNTFASTQSNINSLGSSPLFVPTNTTKGAPFRVKWTVTYASGVKVTWTTFDLVRAPLKHRNDIVSLKGLIPDVVWMEWVQQRGQDFAPQALLAYDRLRVDVRLAGYDPDAMADPEITDYLHKYLWAVVIGEALLFTGSGNSDWLAMAKTHYQQEFQKAIGTGLRAWMAPGSSGAIVPDPPRQMWLRGR